MTTEKIKDIKFLLLSDTHYWTIIHNFYPDIVLTGSKVNDCNNFFSMVEKDNKYEEVLNMLLEENF